MKMMLLLSLLIAPAGYAQNESEMAKKSLRALIEPILQKSVKDPKSEIKGFSVKNCERHRINWMDVILMQKSAALTYTFKPGCDIQGTVYPTILKAFPVDLKLKNLRDFSRLESENKITATIESQPIMNMAVRSARLTGPKGLVKFEADYSVRIDPIKKGKEMVSENMGGEIRITEIYGRPVSIKEKIKVE